MHPQKTVTSVWTQQHSWIRWPKFVEILESGRCVFKQHGSTPTVPPLPCILSMSSTKPLAFPSVRDWANQCQMSLSVLAVSVTKIGADHAMATSLRNWKHWMNCYLNTVGSWSRHYFLDQHTDKALRVKITNLPRDKWQVQRYSFKACCHGCIKASKQSQKLWKRISVAPFQLYIIWVLRKLNFTKLTMSQL